MIEYLKNNYLWIGAVVVPVLLAIIGLAKAIFSKSGRTQKFHDVTGNNNTIINGDVEIK